MICYLHAYERTGTLYVKADSDGLGSVMGFKAARIAHRDNQIVPPETDHNNLIVLTNAGL